MALSDWLAQTRARLINDGVGGVRESVRQLWIGALRRTDLFADPGVNIYERDWDVLVILDGCRTDALREVAPEYAFLDSQGAHRSPGSTSHEWMERTFTDEYTDEIARTVHVTGNPFSEGYLDGERFAMLDEVWRDGWDDETGTVLARTMTDRAIRAGRQYVGPGDRLIVHYMQPHFPSVPCPLGGDTTVDVWGSGIENPFESFRRGIFTEREVWQAYLENLRYVLDEVTLLLMNLNTERVVITADHGNAKGEWWVYGHPNVPLDVLREVPWATTNASDERTHDPVEYDYTENDLSVEDRLSALGYR